DIKPELATTMIGELKTSIELMPWFSHSYYTLGCIHLITGRNYTEGAQVLRIALQLEPQNKQYMLTRAQLQARMKDYAAAKKTLEPLLAADADPGLKASADSLLK